MENKNERRQARGQARGLLKKAIMLIPNFLKLLGRLFRDPRVPTAEKAMVVGAIVYVVSPLDILPDVIPFVGQVDDVYLVSLTLLRLLSRTDGTVLQQHWEGPGDLAVIIDKIALAARYVLPRRVREILLGRVEIAPKVKGGLLSSPAAPEELEDYRRNPKAQNQS